MDAIDRQIRQHLYGDRLVPGTISTAHVGTAYPSARECIDHAVKLMASRAPQLRCLSCGFTFLADSNHTSLSIVPCPVPNCGGAAMDADMAKIEIHAVDFPSRP